MYDGVGVNDLLTRLGNPPLEPAQASCDRRDSRLIVVTGGPAVGRAALRSPKRAIVAGPGNPPVVVDETADLDNAARSIITGGAYDNNLLCIGANEAFTVEAFFDDSLTDLKLHQAIQLRPTNAD